MLRRSRVVNLWAVLVACGVAAVGSAGAQLRDSSGEAALKQSILGVEVARAPAPADLQVLIDAARTGSPSVQQVAVRALGRLERPTVIPAITPLLASSSAAVRAEAANALAQAVQGRGAKDLELIVRPLRERLETERDPHVRGVLFEALGRLPYESAADVHAAETALVAGARDANDRDHEIALGAARGFEALYRVHAKKGPAADAAIVRLRELVRLKPEGTAKSSQENAVRIRRLAVMALQFVGADVETLRAALKDADPVVRKQAASFLEGHGRPNYSDEAAKQLQPVLLDAIALHDSQPMVRYEAVQGYGYYLRDRGCEPLIDAVKDPATVVAQAALGALGRPCPAAEAAHVTEVLRQVAETLPRDDKPSPASHRVEWHRAAHALMSLAAVAPDEAKHLISRFAAHPVWQVRMYAARTAATLKDTALLEKFTEDSADNVRSAAVTGLSRVAGHTEDAIYVKALSRTDHQLNVAAARALQGSPNKAQVVPALVAALQRYTAEQKDNTRDARAAILQRLRELGSSAQADALKPLVNDFDPRIASLAAEALTAWGTPTTAAPMRPRTIAPNLAQVMKLENARMRWTMATGGAFEMRLFPAEAPATVERFVRLAKAGYYNGLTFHRVAPNWVIQGGSPAAQEVTGDSPFMVDEVWMRSHTRGAVGISTRGRDTGDAQLAIDLSENVSLDHNFTVWAEIVSGMDVVDNVIEGDVIRTVDVVPGPSTPLSPAPRH
jgi:cyclophilin family peptidyl-prolyl cis-trans isomerase/HEAT repeat protein